MTDISPLHEVDGVFAADEREDPGSYSHRAAENVPEIAVRDSSSLPRPAAAQEPRSSAVEQPRVGDGAVRDRRECELGEQPEHCRFAIRAVELAQRPRFVQREEEEEDT